MRRLGRKTRKVGCGIVCTGEEGGDAEKEGAYIGKWETGVDKCRLSGSLCWRSVACGACVGGQYAALLCKAIKNGRVLCDEATRYCWCL